MYLAHQRAADIEVGDQLFYRFHRYDVHEMVAQGSYVRVVGTGEQGALYVLLAAGRKLWSLKRREHHDPLHGVRERRVPVWRRPALSGVPGQEHLRVLSRDHVVGGIAQGDAIVEPGVLAVRSLIGSRAPSSWPVRETQHVPYLLSIGGRSLAGVLHTGRRPGFGADGDAEALGQRSMVPDLRAAILHTGEPTLGRDRSSAGAIRIVIPVDLRS